jgi:hypothetical protein
MSELPESDFLENYLIGTLTENDGEYSFRYNFKNAFPKAYLKIWEFPDVNKIYNDAETRKFVNKLIPPKNYMYLDIALKTANLTEYDEWELLKFYGLRSDDNAVLYETLPEGAII